MVNTTICYTAVARRDVINSRTFEFMNEGNTSPGQSHRTTLSVSSRVWKCLVRPRQTMSNDVRRRGTVSVTVQGNYLAVPPLPHASLCE